MSESSDFGSTWTNASGFGMPDNTSFLSLDLIDRDHGIATVFVSTGTRALMLTSDGGQTWHPADFGGARSNVSSTSADPSAAKALADNFAMMADKDPQTAWNIAVGLLAEGVRQRVGVRNGGGPRCSRGPTTHISSAIQRRLHRL